MAAAEASLKGGMNLLQVTVRFAPGARNQKTPGGESELLRGKRAGGGPVSSAAIWSRPSCFRIASDSPEIWDQGSSGGAWAQIGNAVDYSTTTLGFAPLLNRPLGGGVSDCAGGETIVRAPVI